MAATATASRRVLATDEPCIVQMQELLRGATDVISLAQGIVHWAPPTEALQEAKEAVFKPSVSGYAADDGIPELKAALLKKIKEENNLVDSSIMVTAGANQVTLRACDGCTEDLAVIMSPASPNLMEGYRRGLNVEGSIISSKDSRSDQGKFATFSLLLQAFTNVVLATCDAEDAVVLFVPYYFNHLMAFHMSGTKNIVYGQCDPDLHPDADWLEEALSGKQGGLIPKVVVVINPGNPTGTYLPGPLLKRISGICKAAGSWLVVDNTYEYFMYRGLQHECVEGDHVINIFSFSKAYGMMGWRVGYIAYPSAQHSNIGKQLLKVQDTVPICAAVVSQHLALAALKAGPAWVKSHVATLEVNRSAALEALEPLGSGAIRGGEGAIYLWAKLPSEQQDDKEVVEWLAKTHGVCVIPGSACGAPGHLRVAFANLKGDRFLGACKRLREGLAALVKDGMR
eukprot:SM000253S09028  [mRNA]  locus=s253:40424:43594:+ [translate_table: standard]